MRDIDSILMDIYANRVRVDDRIVNKTKVYDLIKEVAIDFILILRITEVITILHQFFVN